MPRYRDPRAYYGPKLRRQCARNGCPLAARKGRDTCAFDGKSATADELAQAQRELDDYNLVPQWKRRRP